MKWMRPNARWRRSRKKSRSRISFQLSRTIPARSLPWMSEARQLKAGIESLVRRCNELESDLTELRREAVDRNIADEESQRMVRLAQKNQDTMKEYLRRQRLTRLTDCLAGSRNLSLPVKKQTLVQRVHIDPETFAIDLFDDRGGGFRRADCRKGRSRCLRLPFCGVLLRRHRGSYPQSSTRQWPIGFRTPPAPCRAVFPQCESSGHHFVDGHGSRSVVL